MMDFLDPFYSMLPTSNYGSTPSLLHPQSSMMPFSAHVPQENRDSFGYSAASVPAVASARFFSPAANASQVSNQGPGQSRRRFNISDEQWENQRETIRMLYVDQKKTLDETMRIMKDEHHFQAW
jgi:Clr5 domain